jgi:hypothetical protein
VWRANTGLEDDSDVDDVVLVVVVVVDVVDALLDGDWAATTLLTVIAPGTLSENRLRNEEHKGGGGRAGGGGNACQTKGDERTELIRGEKIVYSKNEPSLLCLFSAS